MKRQRMTKCIKRQQYVEMAVKRIQGGDKSTLAIVGAGNFSATGHGGKPAPVKRLWRMIAARMSGKFSYQNEDCTSKLCCGCHQVLDSVMVGTAKGRKPSWKVRRCCNNECHRMVLDRNLSAGINIGHLFLCQVFGQDRPAAFEKGTARPTPPRPPWPFPWPKHEHWLPVMQLLMAAPVAVAAVEVGAMDV
jgi:hypothetical protein